VLGGAAGPARDIVLLNTAVSLLIAGAVATVTEGIDQAAKAIDSGGAAGVLDRLSAVSRAGVTTQS